MATTASSVTSSGVLTVLSVTNLMVGQTVQLTGTAFGGLIANKTYYIIAVGSTTISLSLTQGGSALSISGGSGSMVVTQGPRLGPGQDNIISSGSTSLTSPLYGDFNSIQALVAKVLGAPTDDDPRYGYNQLLLSSQVTPGDKVTLSQWVNLRTDKIKARGHQTGSASESNNIALPTSTSKVTETLRLAYFNYATTLTTYRDTIGAGQFEPVTASTSIRTDDWNDSFTSTITMNFGDVASARGFFNAGGQVKFTVQLSDPLNLWTSLTNSKANTWAVMFSTMGTITFDRTRTYLQVGSTGTANNIGFFGLTSSNQLIFTKPSPTGSYTLNEFTINARFVGSSLIFTIAYSDLSYGERDAAGNLRSPTTYTDGSTGQTVTVIQDEYVIGELRQVVALTRPMGSYVSNPAPATSISGALRESTSPIFGMYADKYNVDEGGTVTVTLRTQNVTDASAFQYTVTGVGLDRFSTGNTSGSFIVFGNTATATWVIDNNLRTDGPTTMTVSLNNGLANVSIIINDTSRNPVGSYLLTTVGNGQQWICPPGVRNVSALIVAGGAGGANFAGGGGGAGQIRVYNTTTQPGNTYYITVGAGGSPSSSGQNSDFAGASAIGGSVGTAGQSSGHGGTHVGGGGGNSYGGYNGAIGDGNTGTIMYASGGGGGGQGAVGSSPVNAYTGGTGGAGKIISWYNNAKLYIGGGGGGGSTTSGGIASYGGGAGKAGNTAGLDGQAATGGGGGGGGAYPVGSQTTATLFGQQGGNGGSGLVWIQWS